MHLQHPPSFSAFPAPPVTYFSRAMDQYSRLSSSASQYFIQLLSVPLCFTEFRHYILLQTIQAPFLRRYRNFMRCESWLRARIIFIIKPYTKSTALTFGLVCIITMPLYSILLCLPPSRPGPNELSVVDSERISEVLGGSGLPRGPSKLIKICQDCGSQTIHHELYFQCGTRVEIRMVHVRCWRLEIKESMHVEGSLGIERSVSPQSRITNRVCRKGHISLYGSLRRRLKLEQLWICRNG